MKKYAVSLLLVLCFLLSSCGVPPADVTDTLYTTETEKTTIEKTTYDTSHIPEGMAVSTWFYRPVDGVYRDYDKYLEVISSDSVAKNLPETFVHYDDLGDIGEFSSFEFLTIPVAEIGICYTYVIEVENNLSLYVSIEHNTLPGVEKKGYLNRMGYFNHLACEDTEICDPDWCVEAEDNGDRKVFYNNVVYLYLDEGWLYGIAVKKDDVVYSVVFAGSAQAYYRKEYIYKDTIYGRLFDTDTTYEAMKEIFQFED